MDCWRPVRQAWRPSVSHRPLVSLFFRRTTGAIAKFGRNRYMSRSYLPGAVCSLEGGGDQADAPRVLLCGRSHDTAAGSISSPGEGDVSLFAGHQTSRLGRTGDGQYMAKRRRRFVRPFYTIATAQVAVGYQGKVRFNLSNRKFSWDDEEPFAKVHGCWDGRN